MVGYLAATAGAERAQRGNLIVAFDGGISPVSLPRYQPAPVAVHLAGHVTTSDHSQLPRVNWIRLEFVWRGLLDTRGLPVCPWPRLEGTRTGQAINYCRDAEVGKGRLYARVFLPGEPGLGVKADLVAFNGRTRTDRHVVLVHAYSNNPPISFIIPFTIHRQRFRTVLIALIRRSTGPWPHVANFSISVSRRFKYHGRDHSYTSASCPIPRDFTAGFLSLARATYAFSDGHRIKVEAVRSCRAR
jgi:hypothetical protein